MTPDSWFGLFSIVGIVGLCWLVARSKVKDDTALARLAGVEPTQPWTTESLFERHVNHAIEALERDMTTDAATEDALRSAEDFIHHARRELATRKELGDG